LASEQPEPATVFSNCLGEMYRHRLAVHVQEQRLAAAVRELQARREEIDAEVFELIFHPDFSEEWLREQYETISRREIPEVWRLKNEAQFLLVAVRGVYLMAAALPAVAPAQAREALAAIVYAFEGSLPDALLLRNIHEHLDEYLAGRGRQTDQLPKSIEMSRIATLDKGIAYMIGGKVFLLWEISQAAETLAASIAEYTRDLEY
jgi:hypothetical protein